MRETRIVRKWSWLRSEYYYYAQYKRWGMWLDIYDDELNVWCNNFLYKSSAERAIDRFIANGYTQHKDVTDKSTIFIKYP